MEDVKVNLEIAALISRKAKGLLSREESDRLKDWKRESHENQQIYDCVWSRIQGANPCEKSCKKFDPQKAWNIVSVRIDERPAHKVFFVPLFYKSAAAAAFLFLSGWLLFRWYNLPQPAEEFAFSEIEKPVLILSDSEVIDLEENKKAWIKGEIRHKEKELKYNQSKKNKPFKKTEMHTLAIPEGMCYALELSDGTRVQLNSRTTLRYPSSFSGRERKVYLEGEALFEVAKDKAHPFVVESKQLRTQVF
ncbi:MAG: FecR domain-containing protein [Cytophagales bacterium]|nr:FecR domain-containing protein [Cytophagales bacterium]